MNYKSYLIIERPDVIEFYREGMPFARFDTKTNELTPDKNAKEDDFKDFKRIVCFTMGLLDDNKNKFIKEAALKAPAEWEIIDEVIVHDPDGWRNDPLLGAKSFNEPISREEWARRMIRSTCYMRNYS